MKYSQYNTNDFLKDEYFVQWVTKGDNGTCHFWGKWLQNHPQKANEVAEAKQLIRALGYKKTFNLGENGYTDLLEGILKDQSKKKLTKAKQTWLNPQTWNWAGWAAAAIVIIALGYTLIPLSNESPVVEQSITLVTKETLKGQKNNIKLGDGTIVKLNSSSSLKFPEKFGSDNRIVYLEGEAFFEVAKDAARPFSVVSGNIVTTALGTSFNINNKTKPENVKVALVTGKVKVEDDNGSSIILSPNEMVTYNNGKINKGSFDYNEEIAWSNGKLYFNQKGLEEVFEVLENWYGVKIKNDINLKGFYTGEFENNPSLKVVLDGVAYASGFKYEKNDNTIIIKN